MNFREYVKSLRAGSLDKPKRTVKASSRYQIPHEPGSMSRGVLDATADGSNSRAKQSPASGEVVGLDPSTGEALVRQAGNRVVRVQAEGASAGNTVSIDNPESPRTLSLFGVKKAGSVSNPSSVSSKGWQPVPGRSGVSRLSGTSSREVEGLDKLSDPCTPPEEKLQLVLAEQARGVGITDRGVVGFTSSANGLVLNNQAARETQRYIDQLYEEIKNQGKQQQTLPQNLSLDSTGGTQAISQQFSATQASLWKCVNNVCVQAEDGIFATKEQCEGNCGPKTYSCVNGTCVLASGSTGQFKSLGECINAGCNTRYTCIDGNPVPKKDGEFATLEAAIAGGCYWGYDCNSTTGQCEPAIGGNFKSLQCCQQSCVVGGGGFDPDDPFANGGTVDVSDNDQAISYRVSFVEVTSGCQFSSSNGTNPVEYFVTGPILSISQNVINVESRTIKEYFITTANGTEGLSTLDNDSDNTCQMTITGLSISPAV